VLEHLPTPLNTCLELGCGGGNNAFYLKKHFASMTLTDLSPEMLKVSRQHNPECEHIVADMRYFRLGRQFDVVFIHDAIEYMTTLEDLHQALETAFVHCKPGGLTLIVPDHVRETYEASSEHGGHDSDERSLRYLEWSHKLDEAATSYAVDYVYLLREHGNVRCIHEQHILGLFPRSQLLSLLGRIGFEVEVLKDNHERDIFIASRP